MLVDSRGAESAAQVPLAKGSSGADEQRITKSPTRNELKLDNESQGRACVWRGKHYTRALGTRDFVICQWSVNQHLVFTGSSASYPILRFANSFFITSSASIYISNEYLNTEC